MKSYQLIKYNTRNIFLEKSYTKCGGEASPKLFPKKIKIGHSLKCCKFVFIVCPKQDQPQYIKTKVLAT